MCLIIDQPSGHTLTRARILDVAKKNPHGFGVAYAEEGVLYSARFIPESPEDVADFYARYLAGRRCVIHWRLATSGPKDANHAHPFHISERLAVMHNGMLPGGTYAESDTALLVRAVLKPALERDHSILNDSAFRTLLSGMIRGSRLVFVDSFGQVTRLGDSGVHVDGAWYSNTYAWDPLDGAKPEPRIQERPRSYVWRDDTLILNDPESNRYLESLRRRAAALDDSPTYRGDDADLFSWARAAPMQRANRRKKKGGR